MKKLTPLLICLTVLLLAGPALAQAGQSTDLFIFLPAIYQQPAPAPLTGGIIVDHTHTPIDQIPDRWIDAARGLTVSFAHTSHGSQILTGLNWLENQNPRYRLAVRSTGEGLGLPADTTALRFYDGNNIPGNDYITPELFWSTTQGQAYTRSVLQTGLFNLSGWTWCGQQSDNSADTVNQYLTTLNQFETDFPAARLIYFTGHTDYSGGSSRLNANNDLVRAYARENEKILFDFADFEEYDPSGIKQADVNETCPWCSSYCTQHPAACANLSQMGDCAHTHALQCKVKAEAFWYLAARAAGWDGKSQ